MAAIKCGLSFQSTVGSATLVDKQGVPIEGLDKKPVVSWSGPIKEI